MVKNNKIPKWVWVVIAILLITTVFFYMRAKDFEKSAYIGLEYQLNATKQYIDLTEDWLNLLICYQENLPRCEPLIEKFYDNGVFEIKK